MGIATWPHAGMAKPALSRASFLPINTDPLALTLAAADAPRG